MPFVNGEKDMLKMLKVADPIISVRPPIAALLSIVQNVDGWEKWLINTYYLLYASLGPDCVTVDIAGNSHLCNQREWHSCPYIHKYLYPAYFANTIYNNICEMIEALIDDGQYVFVTINEKYIELYNRSRDLKHELFIYGYDTDNHIFMCRDFWNGHYKSASVSYSQVLCAFENYSGVDDAIGGIAGWKLCSEKKCVLYRKNGTYNADMLYNNIYRYLFPLCAFDRDVEQTSACFWGINAYTGIEKILLSQNFLPPADAYALWAHKFLVKLSIQYCGKQVEVLNEYISPFNEIMSMARLFLLQNIKQSEKCARGLPFKANKAMFELLNRIRISEEKNMRDVLHVLKTNNLKTSS